MQVMNTVFIILNYKTYNETILLTDMLLSQEIGDRAILIVDNASPNESFDVLNKKYQKEQKVEVISTNENGGYAKGNNYGLRYAKKYGAKYVCIINNDVRFDIALIERMEKVYNSLNKVAILAPVQYLLNKKPTPFLNLKQIPTFWDDLKVTSGLAKYAKHKYISENGMKNIQEVEIVPGAFLFIEYSLFEKLGFFYEGTFLFCEERFTAKKIKDNHYHNYILLDECYLHAHSATISTETSRRWQQKLLFEGKVLYTRCYRTMPTLKVTLLKISYYTFLPFRIMVSKIFRN